MGFGPKTTGGGSSSITHVVAAATGDLTVAQCTNSVITNYGQSGDAVLDLPPAAEGMGFVGEVVAAGTNDWAFKPATGEQVVLDGILLDANHKVLLASPALGDTFRALCLQIGANSWRWFFNTASGTYTDGAE